MTQPELAADGTMPELGSALVEPDAVLLVDAHNGFNELGCKSMLWTV
jgi:hypothetical protein